MIYIKGHFCAIRASLCARSRGAWLNMFVTAIVFPALLLGLFGGLHCVGMCGPITMILPVKQHSSNGQVLRYGVYFGGKLLTYIALGLLMGGFGAGLLQLGIQQAVSIGLGCLMILAVLVPVVFKQLPVSSWVQRGIAKIKSAFSAQIAKRSVASFGAIGMLNGLLPCGLVYTALAGALATFSLQGAATFMLFFGIGTMPLLIFFIAYTQAVGFSAIKKIQRVIPLLMIAMGILLILRGLDLGIPYISPAVNIPAGDSEVCR